MLALIAAVAALATAGAPSPPERRCAAGETRAIVGARVVCLSDAAPCRIRYQERYRRYGFRCHAGLLDYDWRPLRRALRVPTIAAGAPCPASAPRGNVAGAGLTMRAFGPGPAYPTLDGSSGRAAVGMVWSPTEPPYLGWAGTKVLWTVPRYTGAVLIRGRQVDGPNGLGFDLGPRLDAHGPAGAQARRPALRYARRRRSSGRPGATPTRSTRCGPATGSCSRRIATR